MKNTRVQPFQDLEAPPPKLRTFIAPLPKSRTFIDLEEVEKAVLQTIAYADIFDYPLTGKEIHRYLANVPAPIETVLTVLQNGCSKHVNEKDGLFTLPGREANIATRQRRSHTASQLWPKAISYGRRIARIPYVRMVAVTGALAVNNVEPDADLDYLIVTEPGRLWLCRAMVILLVRWAQMRGHRVCPNYFLSENTLVFPVHDLYSSHEMVQMVPIAGIDTYWLMRQLNLWTFDFLPNAAAPAWSFSVDVPNDLQARLREYAEGFLRLPWIDGVEEWEMNRKIKKFTLQSQGSKEASFSADWCKGHFNRHAQHALSEYARRLEAFDKWLK